MTTRGGTFDASSCGKIALIAVLIIYFLSILLLLKQIEKRQVVVTSTA